MRQSVAWQAYEALMEDQSARPGQPLREHAAHVAQLAAEFAKMCGMAKLADLSGRYHDMGKATKKFQDYLEDENAERGSVSHSPYGARQVYDDLAAFLPAAEMLANAIWAHHGGLYDNLSPDGETPLLDQLRRETSLLEPAPERVDAGALKAEMDAVLAAMPKGQSMFGLSMLAKLVYSCLVDADRLDAYLSESKVKYDDYAPRKPDWDGWIANLEKALAEKSSDDDMGRLRRHVSESCAKSGALERGIYKLGVPTGGGKTLSSLRFALEHARRHGLDRIIYVIPYLSILSQTAEEIRKVLGVDEDVVLEHHSNILVDPEDEQNYKLHTDRWDASIVLTTQVQFLESVFSARASDLRKLHHMTNSVMIFDEAQSLPLKCVHLFNSAMNFLHRVGGSTILLCTATQPLLDAVRRPIVFTQAASIAVCEEVPARYRLVNALQPGGYAYEELAAFVLEKHKLSTLVIVNTKAAAKALTAALQASGVPVLHLSTNMCSAHREDVIAELRRRLEAKEPVLCVSTQLIEAGVDISLECVIRDLAGLDSILQAAGRCNRHGEFDAEKSVCVVNIAGENLDKLPDIKVGAEIARRMFDDGTTHDIDLYYRIYLHERSGVMDYPLPDGNGSIYDLLSENARGRSAYKNRADKKGQRPPQLLAALRSAADAFYVIDRGRKDVIVSYGDSEKLLDQLERAADLPARGRLLRELGRYSVSLYEYQVKELEERAGLTECGGVSVLDRGFYHKERGVDMAGHPSFLYI